MERYQEMRHICRFCSKSFSCGRALGGHMRTHLATNQSESSEKLSKKKSSSNFINVDDKEAQNGYSLREKPKKTNKFGDLVEESSFDHHEYLNSADQKLVLDHSQSDNEEATPTRKQRSRIIKRYKDSTITTITTTNNNNTTYLHKNNASSSCVSEIEQEQEEVALSLILLSRDVTVHWISKGKSIVDSSEKSNTEFLEPRITQTTLSDSKSENKNIKSNDSESVKLKAMKTAKVEIVSLDYGCLNSKLKQSEYKDTLISRNGIEIISAQVQDNDFSEPNMIVKVKTKEGNSEIKKQKAKKRKSNAIDDHEKVSFSSKNLSNEKSDSPFFVVESEKRSKFECTFCNKIFHSYQALGGHRASHKKMKSGCFSSKIDSSENSTETEISPIQSTDTKSIAIDGISTEKMKILDYVSKKNSDKVHECPICFKVFTSGQALGGHKRSHMLAEAKSNNNSKKNETTTDLEKDENNKNKKKNPEIRDFLDLNLPAPEQDEVAESSDRVYCNPWWLGIGSNHQQEQLLGAS